MGQEPERDEREPIEVSTAQAARGGLATLGGQGGRLIFLVVNLAVLGRLLTPADFGVVAIALSIVGVAELLRDFGLSASAIQAPTLSEEERTNLFWLNSLLGVVLALLIVVLAYPTAALFDVQGLGGVMCGLAGVFVLNGVGTQLQAQLAREFRFATIAGTDLLAQAVGLTFGIVAAVLGAGYWSLVLLQLVAAATLLGLRFAVAGWVPTGVKRGVSIRHHLSFGVNLGLAQLLGYIANTSPTVALGAMHSAATVGYYNRANQLISLPINQVFAPLTNVALSTLSKLSDPDRYRRSMHELALLVSITGVAGFTYIAGTSAALIPLLLGDQWDESVDIAAVLGIGTAFQALTYPYFWAFMSLGRTRSLLRYNLVTKTLLACLAVAGATHGPVGAAVGFAIGLAISWPICAWWLRGEPRIDGRRHLLQSLRLLVPGLIAGAAAWLLLSTVGQSWPHVIQLVLASALWAMSAMSIWIAVGGSKDLRTLRAVVARIRH